MSMRAIAHAELRVEDVEKAADQLVSGYGFRVDEIHPAPRPGTLLVHGGVRLLLLAPPSPGSIDDYYLSRHGDGVSGIAVVCDDPAAEFAHAVAHGAPVRSARDRVIEVFDDFSVRFVAADDAEDPEIPGSDAMFETIDHIAVCVPHGALEPTVELCERALGLHRIFGELIEIGTQAMDSIVVQSESGAVTFTFLEPCVDREPGQIDAFLDAHGGPGVQHLALRTGDIAAAVRALGERDVEFLRTPAGYYAALAERIGTTGIPLDVLRELNVLVDQDHGGQLFQIFTRSVHSRRTFFFELIERRGAGTFGTANIKALYEAVERES
jgi:4-hydroxymandelate synthase